MSRFAKSEVAVDVDGNLEGLMVRLTDASGHSHSITVKGARFDLNGRLVGRVKGYDKRKRYLVNFGSGFDYLIKIKDCHTPNLPSLPAKQPAPAVGYNLWVDGQLVRGYIYPPKRRCLNVDEYSARVDVAGKSVYGKARQDSEGKLYFVASPKG